MSNVRSEEQNWGKGKDDENVVCHMLRFLRLPDSSLMVKDDDADNF